MDCPVTRARRPAHSWLIAMVMGWLLVVALFPTQAIWESASAHVAFFHHDSSDTDATSRTWISIDPEGHEASVTDKATAKVTSYVDDADGNRLIKTDAAAGSMTLYVRFICQARMMVSPSSSRGSKSASWVMTGRPLAWAIAAIQRSLTLTVRPRSRRPTRRAPHAWAAS